MILAGQLTTETGIGRFDREAAAANVDHWPPPTAPPGPSGPGS
jgi:hypothetical protein